MISLNQYLTTPCKQHNARCLRTQHPRSSTPETPDPGPLTPDPLKNRHSTSANSGLEVIAHQADAGEEARGLGGAVAWISDAAVSTTEEEAEAGAAKRFDDDLLRIFPAHPGVELPGLGPSTGKSIAPGRSRVGAHERSRFVERQIL